MSQTTTKLVEARKDYRQTLDDITEELFHFSREAELLGLQGLRDSFHNAYKSVERAAVSLSSDIIR